MKNENSNNYEKLGFIHHLPHADGLVYDPFNPDDGFALSKVKVDLFIDQDAQCNYYLCILPNGLKGYVVVNWSDFETTDN